MTDLEEKTSLDATKDIQDMTFEKAMNELESLVRRLEEGRPRLEDAINSYERGTALRTHCEAKLRAAKLKVEQVLGDQEKNSKAISPQKSNLDEQG
jgi:exodeoxyribonuclease VII small subunit